MTTPTVVELVATLEPITRDDFADEPAEHPALATAARGLEESDE